MKDIRSHPDLRLNEHIAQVKLAMEGICQWHSQKLLTGEMRDLANKLARMHDLGKGTRAFQEYIVNPECYKGDKREKAHSPLSLLLTLILLEREKAATLDTLMLAAAVSGHHKRLPYLSGEHFFEESLLPHTKTLEDFAGGAIARTLKKQLPTLDALSLGDETGIDFQGLDLSENSLQRAKKYMRRTVMPAFYALTLEEKIFFRLRSQLLFSILLEADKAFLAVPNPKVHLQRQPRYWQAAWIEQRIGSKEDSEVNRLRKQARTEVIKKVTNENGAGIYSLTAPTGIGKTLLAATWALTKRQALEKATGIPPKIIVVLPFLSIIDQTAAEYRRILTTGGQEADGAWFLTSHSLSDRTYAEWLEEKAEPFFIDTWRTELVITTYDQFLLCLLDPRVKYQMRFHNLCDALIILDEVQSLPCILWQLLQAVLRGLIEVGQSQIMVMSATLPPFVSDTMNLLEDYQNYFKAFHRYELRFQVQEKLFIQDFCQILASRLAGWLQNRERVLITLNTRRSARLVYDHLKRCWPEKYSTVPLFFISADVTPTDRLRKIELIKEGHPCLAVSTQCIEAGVDMDMSLVIRDFAPWDSIVQIAGRCNREGKRADWAPVEIVDLVNDTGKVFADMIYDQVSLQVTRALVEHLAVIKEEEVLELSERYFEELDKRRDTGSIHVQRFAKWQEDLPVRELLRGKEREKYTFLVVEQDQNIKDAMIKANLVKNRWERREAWRKLASRLAAISVDLYARPGFRPEEIAADFLGHWVLREGYYDSESGLGIETVARNLESGSLIF
ncbi:CRISPR-associated helicase Cas3' [Desulfobacca acetoxidans]